MRVLGLADHLGQVARWARHVGPDVHYLVCDNQRRGRWRYTIRLLASAVRFAGIRGWGPLLRAWWEGRIFVRFRPIHDSEVQAFLVAGDYTVGLHGMGVIYRSGVIRSFGMGILNAHIGRLPEMRGRSVMEWSLLTGVPTGITCFFIDEGIDTGERIVFFEPVSLAGHSSLSSAKTTLFHRDGQIYAEALRRLAAGDTLSVNRVADGRRYYVLSRLGRDVAERLLRSTRQVQGS